MFRALIGHLIYVKLSSYVLWTYVCVSKKFREKLFSFEKYSIAGMVSFT